MTVALRALLRAPGVLLTRPRVQLLGLIVLVALVAAACAAAGTSPDASSAVGASPGASVSAHPSPEPTPLLPASPGADPISLAAWIFTPVFQALFILLAALYSVTGDIGIAIVVLTLIIRALVIPLFRRQTVSQRRMQLLAPEIKELQRRYKGDRTKISAETMALYKERGVNPAAGCLPLVLQFMLLIPMYSVIRDGLTNYDPSAMLSVFGHEIVPLHCSNIVNGVVDKSLPCINSHVWWLANLDVSKAQVLFPLPVIGGLSILALISGLLQLVQSRMVAPPPSSSADSQANIQRQTMMIFPLISIVYGGFLPAGLFLYWIVSTLFSIIQQYLIVGFGSLFPLFGRTPSFALNHKPRFPVAVPAPVAMGPGGRAADSPRGTPVDRAAAAAATVRPRERGRQGRRGRRR
ncbi:MAG TPA: YidC/Oxa1 family membrane protein insertase [Candidatus Saccharimonadales bacterium]|nr:YidC/Oxa1 family membrane protein insertase [Candidatus Saccharimonadales bacterium]